jgi:F-type H+-transporting ATPase subunit delta
MNESKISVRYSRALFQLAVEKKLVDKTFADMIFISEVCRIPEAKEILESPIIVPSKKIAILKSVFEKNIEKITMSLLELLVKNGRESQLPAVARVFMDETRRYTGVTESFLTTAIPVNEKIKKQISEMISSVFKTKVELREIVDKEIIGGFVLKVNDNYIDASVRNKLRKIKKQFAFNPSNTL